MESIVSIVSTVGFPIAMCFVMVYYLKYTHDDHRKDMQRLQEQQKKAETEHAETMREMIQAVNNNTKTMERIFDLQHYIEENDNE